MTDFEHSAFRDQHSMEEASLNAECRPLNAPQVVTFGCRLNAYESEVIQRNAVATGLTNTIIVNTCAVTAEAERQAKQSIRRLKRERPDARIIVTGCAAQIDPAKFEEMVEVDAIVENDRKMQPESFTNLHRHPGVSQDPAANGSEHKRHKLFQPDHRESLTRGRALLDSGLRRNDEVGLQRAFVQVQNGCDHRCTFCIIPYGRGASRSMAIGEIAQETRRQVELGYREVVFTGVDIASYGKDLPGKPGLGQMVRRVLALVPELPRLRLSSLDPAAMDDDLWRLIADEPRFMPHLHLSVQAGDDLILKRMKRRHLREDVIQLCQRAKQLRPDIAFGADFITGFPTETEAMFQNTLDLVEQCELTWLHVFPYSARKGTPAAKMPQVNGAVRRERAARLRALGDKMAERHMQRLVGQTFDMLVEKQGIGCTRQFAKIKLIDPAPVGEIVQVACRIDRKGQAVAHCM